MRRHRQCLASSWEGPSHVSTRTFTQFVRQSPQEHERKGPVSERKILANRQNALRSTGPKTFQGKSNSRKNPLKHGFYAQDLRTAFPLGIEDPRDFEKLHADLRNEWQPVGVSEESEVEQIAVSLWKRNRQWHFENANQRLELLEVQRHKGSSREDAAVACLLVKRSSPSPRRSVLENYLTPPTLSDCDL